MRRVLAMAVVLAGLAGVCAAHDIAVPVEELTGSRTTPSGSGIVGNGRWSEGSEGGFQVSWSISRLSDGWWEYEYTFSDKNAGPPPKPDVSHWVLEVSPCITMSNMSDCFRFASFPEGCNVLGAQWWTADPNSPNSTNNGANNGSPNLPEDIYGIKFNFTLGTYTFESSQQPVWGDFYVKDGRGVEPQGTVPSTAWNTGIATDPRYATSYTGYLARPDGVVIPEPGLCALAGGALLAGAWARRRARTRKTKGREGAAA